MDATMRAAQGGEAQAPYMAFLPIYTMVCGNRGLARGGTARPHCRRSSLTHSATLCPTKCGGLRGKTPADHLETRSRIPRPRDRLAVAQFSPRLDIPVFRVSNVSEQNVVGTANRIASETIETRNTDDLRLTRSKGG